MDTRVWSQETPVEEGWYWFKEYAGWKAKVVEVAMDRGIDGPCLMMDGWDVDRYPKCWWAGPIMVPMHASAE